MSLPSVKVTTSSGHSWTTNVSSQIDEAEAIRYFMGQRVDISADPDTEKFERVIKVDYIKPWDKQTSVMQRLLDLGYETQQSRFYGMKDILKDGVVVFTGDGLSACEWLETANQIEDAQP